MKQQECYIVVHDNSSEGKSAYAFWDEKDAWKSVNEDVDTEVRSLTKEGYEPVVLRNEDSVEVYTSGQNIYYEWHVLHSSIQ